MWDVCLSLDKFTHLDRHCAHARAAGRGPESGMETIECRCCLSIVLDIARKVTFRSRRPGTAESWGRVEQQWWIVWE